MPKTGDETQDEPVSPAGSKMSAEYSLDDRKIIDDKSPSKMSNKSPSKQPPPKSSGKSVTCNVYLLDGENVTFTIDKNDNGSALFDKVCTHLDLIEKDYFALTYTDDRGPSHLKYWLNLNKKISKQKKRGAWVFEFALKFYPPDPSQLRESLTRWLVVLQVRRDLLSGRIPCTFTTYALLGSYNVQADIGEYDPSDHGHSWDYIKDMAFAPNQTPELLEKISELHKQHKGQTPDEAEKGFLDNAKKLAMYGVDLHKAKDSDNNAVMVGVCCSGLLIFRDKLRLNRFVWPKILKLSYKRNHFYIKIRPGELERHETTIMFKLDNHRLAKRLWKTCVEHHAFFRLREAEKPQNNVSFPRFGSKFRYSGRTLYQQRQTAALLDRPPPFFERSQPARNTMPDSGTRSRSMDELGRRRSGDRYEDGMYDPNRGSKEYDPNKYGDERDRKDLKGAPIALAHAGRGGDGRDAGESDTLQRRPYDSDTADRRDRVPSQGDATLDREKGQGYGQNDSMGLSPGGPVEGETDKERRKREKEEDKRRKKEAEEKKKREEEEKKKNKDKKKKGKGDLDTSEDRTDKLGPGEATETAFGVGPGSAGIEGDKLLLKGPHAGGESTDDKNKGKDGYDKDGKDGYDADGNRYPYGKDGYDADGNRYPYGKDGKDADGRGYPYGKDGYDADGNRYPHGKDGSDSDGKDKDKDKDGKGKDGKGKDKDKDGKDKKGGLFGRFKKGKGDSDAEDSPKGKGGKGDKDADKNKGKKGGLADEPDILRDKQGNLLGSAAGFPYGVGLGVGKGDMTGVVGKEQTVDNKQRFIPIPQPIRETKESLKSGYTDNMMPFFHPAATSTVGRGKVPPPVPPKGSHGMDSYKTEKDGVEETRVVQKVVVSGDEEDDFDFDSALADAIRSVTEFNPDMSVERIECVQQIEDVKNGK